MERALGGRFRRLLPYAQPSAFPLVWELLAPLLTK